MANEVTQQEVARAQQKSAAAAFTAAEKASLRQQAASEGQAAWTKANRQMAKARAKDPIHARIGRGIVESAALAVGTVLRVLGLKKSSDVVFGLGIATALHGHERRRDRAEAEHDAVPQVNEAADLTAAVPVAVTDATTAQRAALSARAAEIAAATAPRVVPVQAIDSGMGRTLPTPRSGN